jgi:hypothetical protein
MNSWTALAKLAAGPSGPESRKHPRFRANSMVCDHGEVLDFSATGLRIRFRKAPKYAQGELADLSLSSPHGEHHCQAVVVWIKKESRKSYEVGFQFPDAETAKRMQLFRAAWDPTGDGEWTNR